MSGDFQILYRRHHVDGVTGEFHGDMTNTLVKIMNDPELPLYPKAAPTINQCIRSHLSVELSQRHQGRKWFFERFQWCRGLLNYKPKQWPPDVE